MIPYNACPYYRVYLIGDRFPVIYVIIIVIITIITIAVIIIIIIIIIIVIVIADDVVIVTIVIVIFRARSGNLTMLKMEVFVMIANSLCLNCGTIFGSTSDYSFIIVTIIVIALYL